MKILFTFENMLPSAEADAEVFMTTAGYLAPLASQSCLHIPVSSSPNGAAAMPAGLPVVRAYAPAGPAVLRHFCCGLTMVLRKEFRQADLVYTRNLWIAWLALRFGQRVVFDHYRPWPDQIPPLQLWIRAMVCNGRFLVNICHSEYTRSKYLEIGAPPGKLICIRNGFEPKRLEPALPIEAAKAKIGVPTGRKSVVYTGRINHKKGLALLIEAAKQLPEILFLLVGSNGEGSIETLTDAVANIRMVPWQTPETLAPYLFAADVLVIPPSTQPLAEFGSTVLPLKLFLYMASGRPILAGATPDVGEVLRHDENAYLCRPDCPDALVAGLKTLLGDSELAARLAATALAHSRDLTWDARARKIAASVAERLQSEPAACHGRRRGQFGPWMRQSGRWLVHLIRRRSVILPPDGMLSVERPAAAKGA